MRHTVEPYPEEDSEDLTDQEIETALDVTGVVAWVMVLQAFCSSCPECGGRMGVVTHALRRRKPNLFWRTTLKCGAGHDEQVTCRANWIQESAE